MVTRKSAKKAPPRKPAVRRAPARKSTPGSVAPAGAGPVSREERWQMIAEAAYYRGKARSFAGGHEVADWLEAEAEIDARLRAEGREPR